MRSFWQDLSYGARALRRQPGLACAAGLTLALGIGANTAVFGIVNALLLHAPNAIRRPEEIALVGRSRAGADVNPLSYPDYVAFRDGNASFEDIAAFRDTHIQLTSGETPALLSGMLISGNYFRTLGTRADLGRTILPDDDRAPGADAVVVLSHRLWRRRFGADPNVVGKVIDLNGSPFTIIGVAQEGFAGTEIAETVDVWLPLCMYAQANPGFSERRLDLRQISWLGVLGRLKPGTTLPQALADLTTISRRLEDAYPDVDKGWGVALSGGLGLQPQTRAEARARTGVLFAIAGLVLLIASVNVANLLLARGEVRRKEFAVRLALGADGTRLLRQLLAEALLIAAIGGAIGLLVATWSRRLIIGTDLLVGVRLSPEALTIDMRVLGFTLAVSVLSSLVFGLAPARGASRLDLPSMLKDRSATGSGRTRLIAVLVLGQIGLSIVVLICAGLFVRTLQNAASVRTGFDADRILELPLDPGRRGYSEAEGRVFYQRVLDRVSVLRGVEKASLAVTMPLGGSWRNGVRLEGQPTNDPDIPCDYDLVGPRFFEAAGIALVRGREFTEHDQAAAPAVVIVNETFARRMFPQDDPLGKRISLPLFPGDTSSSEIVGVARDIKYERLTEPARMYLYVPLFQHYQTAATLLVRSKTADVSNLARAVALDVAALDKGAPVYPAQSLRDRLRASLAPQRAAATLLSVLGLLALVLASVGLYGVLAYSVGQRRQEIGIRMALGANSRDVLALVLRQGGWLVAGGVAVGVPIALVATRAVSSQLYGVSPADPVVCVTAILTLTITAIAACYFPARGATRVDPLVTLRN